MENKINGWEENSCIIANILTKKVLSDEPPNSCVISYLGHWCTLLVVLPVPSVELLGFMNCTLLFYVILALGI